MRIPVLVSPGKKFETIYRVFDIKGSALHPEESSVECEGEHKECHKST